MDSHSITLIVVIIILIGLSAFFSATETAFSSLNKVRLKNLAQENKRAKLALKLAENYDELISSILVGNNIVNIASTTLATVLFVSIYKDTGATISTIVMTVAVLIFGEITPKSLAKENPENFAMAVAPIMRFLLVILKPINFLLIGLKAGIRKLLGVKTETSAVTDDEILTMVDEAEQEGGIDSHESELIKNVIDFNDLEAIDIMTPRIDVYAVDKDMTTDEVREIFKESGFSRLPVYEETIDSIIGVINEKDFHNYIMGTELSFTEIMKPAEFIPPSMKLSELLRKLQKNKLHIAVIVDEFGGTEGIVTLEDIIEEIVGDIWDEHDEIEDGVKELGDNKFIIPTTLDLDELFDYFEIEDETEASTINGWVIQHTDKIPDEGDSFEFDNLSVTVTKIEGQKAEEILIKKLFEKVKSEEDEI
ncbi:MAG: HlyC/CorC family transporter [Clostridia bacterium]|nr:HlyC/CorC family transporter [Clostridia bacterium]